MTRAGKTLRIRDGRGVLILDHQGIGNVVMSIPLLRAVSEWARDRWPVWVTLEGPARAQVLAQEGLNIIPIYYQPKCNAWERLSALRAALQGQVDLVIAIPQISALKTALLTPILGARHSVAEAMPRWSWALSSTVRKGWTKPILESQQQIAAVLGIEAPLNPPSIRVTVDEADWARSTIAHSALGSAKPLIGLHCSSGEPTKKWQAANFGEVVRRLKCGFSDLAVISFGSAAERTDADAARLAAGPGPWLEGAGAWTIRQSLAMLNQCDLVITADTGIMHMAAAVGARTLSVFGPTSAQRLAPSYNIGTALFPRIACCPCFRDRFKKCSCMNLIGPQHVVLAARELICTAPGKSEHAAGDGCMLPSCLAQYETYPTVNWQRSWRAEPCQPSRVSGGATAHHCETQTGSQS